MAEIAVMLAAAAAGKLAEELVGWSVGKMSLLVGVREEIQFIADELEMMRGFLADAEERQAVDAGARAWVKQVRQLAYDVEDCLDDFSLHLHRVTLPNQLARLGQWLGSSKARHRIATQIQDIKRIATQIQDIKRRVEEVSSRRMRYGIVTTDAGRTDAYADADVRRYDPRMSALFVEYSELVGIDGPREELVGRLLDEVKQLSLIAIVGGGGLGKTTIAKKAYDEPRVTGGHFNCRAWITVSQTYNVEGILRDIIKQLIRTDDPSSMERVQLIEKLRGHLEQKRYLIVFDDVWAIDAWKSLQMALPKNELGSRIILTTRKKELAESACATPNIHGRIHHHSKLTPEQSIELFLRRVFKDPEQKVCPVDLEDLTRAILEKCDGLPLAIISIAGVLASKPDKSRREWEEMKSRLGSELERNPDLEGMNQILTLSYNDLPYHVRHCFLYLSKFPEDYEIERRRIQRLWVAEGLVLGRHDMTAQEVAKSYFYELANRFMIIPSSFGGKVRSFRVHDIMLELILWKSREESFLSCIVGNEDRGMVTRDAIRRLSVHGTNQQVEQKLSLSHVRSLTIHRGAMPTLLISSLCGMLRVLDLEGCDGLENKHLEVVAKLPHLKYLSMRRTDVDELPGCMNRLRKLETLDISCTKIKKLPEGINELQQLRFLYGMGRILDSTSLEIPRGIGMLSALRVLSGINAKRSGKQAMKELCELTCLQKLVVSEISEELMKDFCDSLAAMHGSLRSLSVWGPYTSRVGYSRLHGLNSLSEAPLLLERLDLCGELEGLRLPTWVLSLSNLVKLRLKDSRLGEDAIQSLGKLPNLIRLELEGEAFEGESLCFGAQGFLVLKRLTLRHIRELETVSFQRGAMCQLEIVSIWFAHETCIRGISGIPNLPSLKEMFTDGVAEERVGWLKNEVREHLRKHPNLPTLFLS